MRLADKSVVVTGATGIAAAAVRAFVTAGARVFFISLEEEDCRQLAADVEAAVGWVAADLTEEEGAVSAFASAASALGSIDGLFAVAGGSGRVFGDGPLDQLSLEGWTKTLEMNGHPMFLAVREAVRLMSDGGGSIVIVSSVLATDPVPGLFATHAYAAAKGAANALTTSLAAYYAPQRVRVNAVAPGLVRTPMSARAAADETTVAYAAKKQPLAGGFLEASDVADAALFLLSDESSQITGQVLAVDGGWSVTEA